MVIGTFNLNMMLKIEFFKIIAPMDLLAPHTSGPRDVPRCGALSLLQKDAALQVGIQQKPL
jgi:hypothetical protein